MSTHAWNEQARSLIGQAVLAPSSHNTQPWYFHLSAPAIELWADRTRALPVNDPEDRELAISCGCALMNLRVAAAGAGLGTHVQLLPDSGQPDWLASVSLGEPSKASAEEAPLAPFVERRRTYRKRFELRAVGGSVLDPLLDAAIREGARLHPLSSEQARLQTADLVAEGDAAQWANPSWRRELAAWMHPRRRDDGLTVPTLAARMAQLVVRTFDIGNGVAAKDRELAEGSPLLAVLSTESDHPRDWLLAGQALQRVLLVACQQGLQASYLNQPIQVPTLRPRLQELAGGGFPQILLRLGYPVEKISPTPRRSLDAVIA